MDFRPTKNTLIANYVVTFGVVGAISFFSLGKPTNYYYSPEHNSHGGYGGASQAQSCRQCHVKAFEPFDEKTCWTSGCHSNFDPGAGPASPELLAATQSESSGERRDNYGAILGFHRTLGDRESCDSCHPSHRLPQSAPFNEVTMYADLKAALEKGTPEMRTADGMKQTRAEIFHRNAAGFIGKVSCQTCHLDDVGDGKPQPAISGAAAALLQPEEEIPQAPPGAPPADDGNPGRPDMPSLRSLFPAALQNPQP